MSRHSSPQKRQWCLKLKVVDPDRRSRFSADVSSEPFNALSFSWCATWMCTWIHNLYDKVPLTIFSANSLLSIYSWRASDLRLLDSMIICILSVPVTLLQKMQHFPSFSSTWKRRKKVHILPKILLCSLLKLLNLILCPSKHGDRHKIIFITFVVTEIFTQTIFSVMASLLCLLGHKILVWSILKWLTLILYPSQFRNRHQNYFGTLYNYQDIDENIFSNGGLNLHIARISERCQSGITDILKEQTS